MPAIQISNLLSTLEKTAAQTNPTNGLPNVASAQNVDANKVAEARRAMREAAAALTAEPAGKTASAPNDADVSARLLKMATDLANAEEQAMLKQASFLGAAVADGFVSRLNQHGAVAIPGSAGGEKTASADEIKLAWDAGYNDGLDYVQQVTAGGGDEKTASFNRGYADSVAQIQEMAKTAEGREKLAAVRQGYEATMAQAEKLAHDCYSRGYNDTIRTLQQIAPHVK